MTDINELIDKIIPYPADHSRRNGFNNEPIIDGLNSQEKAQVKVALLNKLSEHPEDLLIVETLAYLKSEESLDILHKLLQESTTVNRKIIIASCIYEISKDEKMVDIVFESGKTITDKYSLTSMHYYMAKMKNKKINELISEYTNHSDYLVSYNAKRYLELFKQTT